MSKKVLAIYGSSRGNSNSAFLIDTILQNIPNVIIDKVYLAKEEINPCIGCFYCRKNDFCCIKDSMNSILAKIAQADIIIFSIPIYMFQMSGRVKNFIDRCYPLLSGENGLYENKLPKKKTAIIYSQGAPVEKAFEEYIQINSRSFELLGFDIVKHIVCTSSNRAGDIKNNKEKIEEAIELANTLRNVL